MCKYRFGAVIEVDFFQTLLGRLFAQPAFF